MPTVFLSVVKQRIDTLQLTAPGIAWLYLLVVLVYAYPAILPSFNSDDIIQVQTISQDTRTFIAQGRWGYFVVFEWFQNTNPGGLFYSAVGCALLLLSSWFAARIIGFHQPAAVYAFMLVSCVSIYYGMLFDFSSTRVAYPLANVCALGGLYAIYQRRYILGMVALILAPSLYPAAAQVAGVILLCLLFMGIVTQQHRAAFKHFFIGTAALLAALALYYIITAISYRFIGIEASSRMSVSPLAFMHNAQIIKSLFVEHSIAFVSFFNPTVYDNFSIYISLRWLLPLLGMFGLFVLTCVALPNQRLSPALACLLPLLVVVSLFAPFALAFAGSNTPFPPRSLIGLASLHAFWVAFVIERVCRHTQPWRLANYVLPGALLCAALFVFDSASQLNKFAFDKYLATQADFLATNRIISRIELTAANLGEPLGQPQPLVVLYETPLPASPTGDAGTARFAPWSREWIFRLADPRYIPVYGERREAALEAAKGRADWPAEESVFFVDGVAVVIINQTSASL
ncbi:glucosyltransferase domain-containing protein [Halomonas sp.]|uniref:glucosyltransferase domain-containing protein n=1 Tax=Halomonas sp. TaxID=1486246 RepID=UPI003F9272CC